MLDIKFLSASFVELVALNIGAILTAAARDVHYRIVGIRWAEHHFGCAEIGNLSFCG